jgi:transposase
MEQPTTIGIDLAKNVFQLHGVDASGGAILKRKLRRGQVLEVFARRDPCLIGLEACAFGGRAVPRTARRSTSPHFWARELTALGHEVRIMPLSYFTPYVKRGKTDAADAEAICEAVTRPTMRFVPVKSAERQAALLNHTTRDFLVRQRRQLVNTIRAHLSEFGIVWQKALTPSTGCSKRQRTCPRRRDQPSTCSQTSCARRRKRSMT